MILPDCSTLIVMNLSRLETSDKRRKFLETKLKIRLEVIKKAQLDEEKNIHCENLIGATTLPLGVAGPIKIKNLESGVKDYYIPLATTEGALVASVNRGCKVITLSGGDVSAVEFVGVTRGPVFETLGIKESLEFKRWLDNNFNLLKKEAEKTSSHLKFLKLAARTCGRYVYVRFYFDSDQAMGMNMVTIASDSMVRVIELKTKAKCLAISGNFCVDKKPSWLNFVSGRGRRAWAEVVLRKEIIKNVLKTTVDKLYDVWLGKCLIGSAMSGTMGFNSHFANIIAAFFAATGQDLAHVVEGSLGITTAKIINNKDLYISVYLPDLMIGMVGGGTELKIKKEALSIIGAKDSSELAQVLASAVLAGEISLLSSLAEGSLAQAHKNLGR